MLSGALGLAQPLAACQPAPAAPERSDRTDALNRPGAATPIPLQTAAPEASPLPSAALVLSFPGEILSLDPYAFTSEAAIQVWGDLVYQSLTMFDEKLKVVPALAESWTQPGPTTWIFELRRGVRFHNGDELEADDIAHWFGRISGGATASPHRDLFQAIEKVEPLRRYTVQMTLSTPHTPLLATLASLRGSAIVPRRWAAGTDLADQAIGTGPFRIADFVRRSYIRYERHPSYWERGLPHLHEVILDFEADEAARIDGLRRGRLQYTALSPASAQRLARDPAVQLLRAAGPDQLAHVLNVGRKPFDDVRVRQAISLAIERDVAIERVVAGQGRLTGPVPTGHGDWPLPPDRLPRRRDLERAKQLMADAGYAGEVRTTIKTEAGHPLLHSLSALMAQQLAEIGIQADVIELDGNSLRREVGASDFDVYAAEIPFLGDPDSYLSARFHSGGAQNHSTWSSERFDELVDTARQTVSPWERKRLYDEAQAHLLDQGPAIWWLARDNLEALHASVREYAQSFTGRRSFLKRAWLARLRS
jgi:peptide/nickel transport system substrate-binding protein